MASLLHRQEATDWCTGADTDAGMRPSSEQRWAQRPLTTAHCSHQAYPMREGGLLCIPGIACSWSSLWRCVCG